MGTSLLAGCTSGSNTRIDGRQLAYVDADQPQNIALLLETYRACDRDDQDCLARQKAIHELQSKFENCIARGLSRTAPHVSLIGRGVWDRAQVAGALLEQMEAGSKSGVLPNLEVLTLHNVDYLVTIGVSNSRSENRLYSDGSGGADGGVWVVGQEWTKTATIESRVFSVDSSALVGDLRASLSEEGRWFVPVLLVVPLPPVGWSPDVESVSCTEMGEALGRFFSGAGNDFIES